MEGGMAADSIVKFTLLLVFYLLASAVFVTSQSAESPVSEAAQECKPPVCLLLVIGSNSTVPYSSQADEKYLEKFLKTRVYKFTNPQGAEPVKRCKLSGYYDEKKLNNSTTEIAKCFDTLSETMDSYYVDAQDMLDSMGTSYYTDTFYYHSIILSCAVKCTPDESGSLSVASKNLAATLSPISFLLLVFVSIASLALTHC